MNFMCKMKKILLEFFNKKYDLFLIFIYFLLIHIIFHYDTGSSIVIAVSHLFAMLVYFVAIRNLGFKEIFLFHFYILLLAFLELYIINDALLYVIFIFLLSATFCYVILRRITIALVLSISFLPYYYLCITMIAAFFIYVNEKKNFERKDFFEKSVFYFAHISLFLIILPIFYLLFQSTFQTLYLTFSDSNFQEAVYNSIFTSLCSSIIILIAGLPVAYALVKFEFSFKNFIDTLIDLPILVPQSVIGIALLYFVGPKAPLGIMFKKAGINFYGTYYGIIASQVIVAFPFFIRSVTNALAKIPYQYDVISKSMGANSFETFKRVTFPLLLPAIFDGFLLSFARAISEFGTLVIMAYEPYTLPVYAYDILIRYGLTESQPVAVIFLMMALWVFFLLRYIRLKIEFKTKG